MSANSDHSMGRSSREGSVDTSDYSSAEELSEAENQQDQPATTIPALNLQEQATFSVGKVYKKPEDLSQAQIRACADIWKALKKTMKNGKFRGNTTRRLWRAVFRGWSSDRPERAIPKLPPRNGSDSSVLVGCFKHDAPNKQGTVNPDRMRGQPIYLKLHTGGRGKEFDYVYCDGRSRIVSRADVKFSGRKKQFFAEAMIQRDRLEKIRLKGYNNELAVYIVQRRIAQWTKNGYPCPVDGERTLFKKFEKVILCRDLIRFMKEVGDVMDQAAAEDEGDSDEEEIR